AVWTGATNLAMLPACYLSSKHGFQYEAVIGLFTVFTSSAYHVCESLDVNLLGFNEGRWHHMDNIFAIASLMGQIINFAQAPPKSALREIQTTCSVSLCIILQLMSPWDVNYTIIPLVAAFVWMILVLLFQRRLPRLDYSAFRIFLLFIAGAALCFVKGLDERKDWLRLWHGGWHLCIGAVCYFSVKSVNPRKLVDVLPGKEAYRRASSGQEAAFFWRMGTAAQRESLELVGSVHSLAPHADAANAMSWNTPNGHTVEAVMQTMPFLDQGGITQALSILDAALSNAQQAKALETLVASSSSQQIPFSPSMAATTELLRAQVAEQQRSLLSALHLLRATAVGKQAAMTSAPAPGFGGQYADLAAAGVFAALGVHDPFGVDAFAAQSIPRLASPSSAVNDYVLSALVAQNLLPQNTLPIRSVDRHVLPTAGPPNLYSAKSPQAPQGPQEVRGYVLLPQPQAPLPQTQAMPQQQQQKPAKPTGGPRVERKVQTLSASLQMLSHEDPDALIIVRRINKLGFKAARRLKQHFSKFGRVLNVLVAHSTSRGLVGDSGGDALHARHRPSSLGFVHMASAEAVAKVLAEGPEQEVEGEIIRVQKFERQHGEVAAANAAKDEQ
ncbi:unnamed protein product, partial [Polarella glacialis]